MIFLFEGSSSGCKTLIVFHVGAQSWYAAFVRHWLIHRLNLSNFPKPIKEPIWGSILYVVVSHLLRCPIFLRVSRRKLVAETHSNALRKPLGNKGETAKYLLLLSKCCLRGVFLELSSHACLAPGMEQVENRFVSTGSGEGREQKSRTVLGQ